ncbi:hypothetical protein ACJX0J_015766 [Zea mays]
MKRTCSTTISVFHPGTTLTHLDNAHEYSLSFVCYLCQGAYTDNLPKVDAMHNDWHSNIITLFDIYINKSYLKVGEAHNLQRASIQGIITFVLRHEENRIAESTKHIGVVPLLKNTFIQLYNM